MLSKGGDWQTRQGDDGYHGYDGLVTMIWPGSKRNWFQAMTNQFQLVAKLWKCYQKHVAKLSSTLSLTLISPSATSVSEWVTWPLTRQMIGLREGVKKNGYFTADRKRLPTPHPHLPLRSAVCEFFWCVYIVRGLKNAFFMSLTPPLYCYSTVRKNWRL